MTYIMSFLIVAEWRGALPEHPADHGVHFILVQVSELFGQGLKQAGGLGPNAIGHWIADTGQGVQD